MTAPSNKGKPNVTSLKIGRLVKIAHFYKKPTTGIGDAAQQKP
jgi:hypothetical protein